MDKMTVEITVMKMTVMLIVHVALELALNYVMKRRLTIILASVHQGII
jgi:hypothetical protein